MVYFQVLCTLMEVNISFAELAVLTLLNFVPQRAYRLRWQLWLKLMYYNSKMRPSAHPEYMHGSLNSPWVFIDLLALFH